jgi:putative FmdB family regulatory protein
MPIYEYCCDKCRAVFEEWTRHIDDDAECDCPQCGGKARRIVSHTSFVLKGSGWYVTDYGYRKGKDETGVPADSSSASKAAENGSPGAAASAHAPAAPAGSSGKSVQAETGANAASSPQPAPTGACSGVSSSPAA